MAKDRSLRISSQMSRYRKEKKKDVVSERGGSCSSYEIRGGTIVLRNIIKVEKKSGEPKGAQKAIGAGCQSDSSKGRRTGGTMVPAYWGKRREVPPPKERA